MPGRRIYLDNNASTPIAETVRDSMEELYAPKGIGALYVRRGLRLEPLIHGAGHESGRRAGTEAVPLVIDEIAASTGSACHAGEHSLSPVLAAMGMSPDILIDRALSEITAGSAR